MFKIFIVEDDEKIADIMVQNLSKTGHIVKASKNFSDIVPEFTEFQPDLVLMDIIGVVKLGFFQKSQ